MLTPLLTTVVPIVLVAGVGFLWSRSGRPLDTAGLSLLVADVGTPCLVVATLSRTAMPPEAFAKVALASAVAILGFALVGAGLLALTGLRLRTYLPSVTFPNSGNLGLPLALYAFGQEGLGYAIIFFAIASVLNNTLGQALTAGKAEWRAVLRAPVVLATLVGLGLVGSGVALPTWLERTLSLLGQITVPLMLLLLGTSLGQFRVRALGRAAFVSGLRVGVGALVGLGVAMGFGLEGLARASLILQCSMPVAVINYLFAKRWNSEPEEVAGLVFVSTVTAIVSVPVLLLLLRG